MRVKRFSFLDTVTLIALLWLMAAFMFGDPFKISNRTIDLLRLKYPIFTKEPRLLFYAALYIGSFIAKAMALLFIMISSALRGKDIDEELALTPPSNNNWKKFILPFAVSAFVIRALYSMNPLIPNLPIRFVFPEAMLLGNVITIFSVIFIAPIAEEIIFRGYIFNVLDRAFGAAASIIATSLIFAAAHMAQLDFDILGVAIIFLLGLIFSILRYRTKSTLVPIFFHGLYNLISIAVGVAYYFILGY